MQLSRSPVSPLAWAVSPRALARTLTGHTQKVHGVAFSPDGRLLATASADNTAQLDLT
jgi:WD40 repeat protein